MMMRNFNITNENADNMSQALTQFAEKIYGSFAPKGKGIQCL